MTPHGILPQSGLSCQRSKGRRQYSSPLAQDKRFLARSATRTFTATTGTAFYRLRTSAGDSDLVVTLMAHGCPLQAIVVALDLMRNAPWLRGAHGPAVKARLSGASGGAPA